MLLPLKIVITFREKGLNMGHERCSWSVVNVLSLHLDRGYMDIFNF